MRVSPSPRWRGEGRGEGPGAHAHNAPRRAGFVHVIGFRGTDPGPSPSPLPASGERVTLPASTFPTSLREAAFSHEWEKVSRPPSSLRAEGEASRESCAAPGLPRRLRLLAMTERCALLPLPAGGERVGVRGLGHMPTMPHAARGFVHVIGFRGTGPRPLTLPSPRQRGRGWRAPSVPHPTRLRRAAFSHEWEKEGALLSHEPSSDLASRGHLLPRAGEEFATPFSRAWDKEDLRRAAHACHRRQSSQNSARAFVVLGKDRALEAKWFAKCFG